MVAQAKPLFPLGQVVATPGAMDVLEQAGQTPAEFLRRHVVGDWGEVDQEDWQANDLAVWDGSRILSAYKTANGERIWIITEADRSSTCCLRPLEY